MSIVMVEAYYLDNYGLTIVQPLLKSNKAAMMIVWYTVEKVIKPIAAYLDVG
jgi:hypothetical protein